MNDLLNRAPTAKRIFQIIKNQDANVFSINAPWGAGKTFFLGLLEKEAKQSSSEVVFIKYNAWESDFADHPMLPLIMELEEQLATLRGPLKRAVNSFIKGSQTVFEKVVKATTVSGKISSSDLLPTSVEVEASIDGEKLFKKEQSTYLEYKEAKQKFKTLLQKLTTELNKQIIICIDELDRCQPIYAIRTSEVLKHFFQKEGEDLGVKFVLAVDKQQMQNTIKTIYGIDANTECYLRKFIDVEFFLPQPTLETFIEHQFKTQKYDGNTLEERLIHIAKKQKVLIAEFTSSTSSQKTYKFAQSNNVFNLVISPCVSYVQTFKLELRDIEKLCLKLNIILTHIEESSDQTLLFFDLLFVWLSLQVKNSHLFHELKNVSQNKLSKYSEEEQAAKYSYFIGTPRLSNFYNFLSSLISYKQELETQETSPLQNLQSTKKTVLSRIGIDINEEAVLNINGWVRYSSFIDFVAELG
ncbi:MAG: P-loop NTPase fold protein [Vampirovibrionales bacterium]